MRAMTSASTAAPRAADPRARPGVGALLPLGGLFVVSLLYHAWLEFRAEGMHGVDGYFHIKLAHLYSIGELSVFADDFRWMTCSAFNDLRCDWQLGYHLILVPFTWMGLLLGGKLSSVFFAALVPTVVFGILRAERVRFAWAYAALLFVPAEYYLVRVHLARPTSPVIAMLLLSTYFAGRGWYRSLFACVVCMLLTYAVPHNAIALMVVATVAARWTDGVFRWRLIAAVCAAIVVGMILHPGFWQWRGSFLGTDHALFNVWRQISGSLEASENGDRIRIAGEWVTMHAPAEFRALPIRDVAEQFSGPLAIFATAVVLGVLALRARRANTVLVATCGMAAAYFVLFVQHVRFAEYWIPFTVLAVGLTAQRALDGTARRAPGVALALVLGVVGVASATGSVPRAANALANDTGIGLQYERPMAWLAEHTDEGAVVFHARWPQFCPMFYFNHRNRYLIGLDSYFFYQHDPLKYERWMQITLGELDPKATRDAILEFDSRYVLVKRGIPLDLRLSGAPGTRPMYEDAVFRIYEIRTQ